MQDCYHISHLLDAVLPLKVEDYERSKILRRSLELFFNDLRICWVVTPDKDYDELKSHFREHNYCVVPESSLVPEFRFFRNVSGWYKQQLIKLAIAERIETDFYLTLDSDVICIKPVFFSDLVKKGRAYCYKHSLLRSAEEFRRWYVNAERVLRIPRAEFHHNVTPAVINREAMLKLHEYLSRVSHQITPSLSRNDVSYFLARAFYAIFPKKSFATWRLYLLRSLPWTEYSLYFTFLEVFDLFEKYHFCLEQRMTGNSVWYRDEYPSWDPKKSFTGERNFCFSVIQSNARIDPDEIWQKVQALQ